MDLNVNDNYYVQSADYLNGIDAQRIPGASLENIDGTRMVSASQMLKHANRYDGDVVTFEAEAGIKLQSLLVNIDAVQEGSGDPAPDNVRAITEWTGMTVSHAGSNIADSVGMTEGYYIDGNGDITANANYEYSDFIPVDAGDTVIISAIVISINAYLRVHQYDEDQTWIRQNPAPQTTDTTKPTVAMLTVPSGISYLRFSIRKNFSDLTIYNPVTETSISWQDQAGTVYGGTLDVCTGKLTVTHLLVDASTLSWTMSSTDFWANLPLRKQGTTTAMCSQFKNRTPSTSTRIYLETDGSFADAVAFAAFLAAQTAADTPVQIVYELQTPIVVWIDPVPVYTLEGENNIFADTGAIADAVVPFYPLEHIWQILY